MPAWNELPDKTKLRILEVMKEASADPVVFINKFLYTFDPKREPYHLPFILFDYQEELVRELVNVIQNGEDLFVEKCREMGVTYVTLAVLLWFWRYIPGSNFLLGSRKEQYVDNRGGSSEGEVKNKEESLFGKLEYMIDRILMTFPYILPAGFNKKKNFTYMSLVNPENGNVISGESANPNFSRGGRHKAVLLDEFAFWDNDCLRDDTEVLTDSGWKLVKDCTLQDQVYSMNTDTGDARLMPITKLHKVYADNLYEFKGKSVDISCTANHKMLIKKRHTPTGVRKFLNQSKDKARYSQSVGEMYYRRADEVFTQYHDFIPLTSNYIGGEELETIYGYKVEDFVEFLGWFISEGCSSNRPRNRKIGIAQSSTANPENVEQIKSLLIRMDLPLRYHGTEFQIAVGHFPKEMFDELCLLGKSHNKFIPQKYLQLKKSLLLILFETLIKGDGSRVERLDRMDKLGYFTTSSRLADNVQELAQKIGLRASISRYSYDNGRWRGLYRLNIGFKSHAQVAGLEKKIITYNDYAYCVTTPYHSLYVRRNGIASWCGNTAAWGGTADTSNCRIVLTTPGIRPCKAKRLRFGKDNEEIKLITLPYSLDPRKTPEWLDRERRRRSAEDFAREIMINWEVSITGRVYEEIKLAQVGAFPYNPDWPLYISWDFGLDGLALQWWQKNIDNGKKRLVEAYENNNKPIEWYFPFLGRDIDSKYEYAGNDLDVINLVKTFKKAVHYGDPDVSKRTLVTGTSARQALEAIKVYVQTKPEANDFVSRRERTKVMFQDGVEVNGTKGTEYWRECIQNARYPQRQEQSQATSSIVLPIHDWTSHHRTSTEYFAVNYREIPKSQGAVVNEVNEDPY